MDEVFTLTREGLANLIMLSIASSEGKQISGEPRDYTLGLLAEVIDTIDGKRPYKARDAGRLLTAGQPTPLNGLSRAPNETAVGRS